MKNKPAIVITSINPPTEAVIRFGAMNDHTAIMIGDKKTPVAWHCDGVEYVSPESQQTLPYQLTSHLPWNRPARANLGYLHAMASGAPYIMQCDDDNIPTERFKVPESIAEFETISGVPFVNIYSLFTDTFVWPRGYPLDRILAPTQPQSASTNVSVGVWQHLADRDTDVDAIYRLTKDEYVTFNERPPCVLAPDTVCPFNCQSTTFFASAFMLMYLPVTITPRASDIVRGLVAQPILWNHGLSLGFTSPTVYQERNPHNYLRDFADEMLIYLHSEDILRIAKESVRKGASMEEDLRAVYQALNVAGFVSEEEITAVDAWILDVQTATKK